MTPTRRAAMGGAHDAALDVAALGQWLVAHGEQVDGSPRARRIGQGQSNLTYGVSDEAGRRWVARRPPLGRLLASAHDVAREHRVLSALAATDVPTPAVLGLVEDAAVCEAPVLVMEFVDGVVLDRVELAEAMPAERRRRIGPELADVLARLHAVDVDAVGLADFASHSPYAPRQLSRWTRQLEASRTRERPALDRLTRWLHAHAPERTSIALVHGDLHVRNVLLDPGTARVRATLDWELCTLGDPLADLGTTLAYWSEPGDEAMGLFEVCRLAGFSTREEVAEAYAERSGRDLAGLGFWQVLGLWKVAIIVDGIIRRTVDEPANAAEGGPPPEALIDSLLDRALTLARP